jgi:hypothetical protein
MDGAHYDGVILADDHLELFSMKKCVFYPILFALNPILLLFSANVSDIPLTKIFPVILIIPLICGGLFFALARMLKDCQHAGFLVFLLEIWFFHYGTVHSMAIPLLRDLVNINIHWLLIPTWSLLFLLLGSNLVWKNVRSPQTITSFLNTLAVVLIVFSVGRIILDIAPRYSDRPLANFVTQALPQQSTPQSKPDIYYIIVDGYARQDVLSNLFQYDNQPFIQELENRGFQIPSHSKSNYMQTALSLASSLNLDYLIDISPNMPDRGQLIGRISHSQVRVVLEKSGYQTVTFSSGYLPTDITNADSYFTPEEAVKNYDFEALLAVNSLIKPFFENGWLSLPIGKYHAQQERILFTFETLSSLPIISTPKFVFAHLLVPHPPFIFNQNGPITPQNFYILADGERLGGTSEAYQLGYIDQIQFTNWLLLETIDHILENSAEPPVIIIQADHGSGMFLNTALADSTCHFERFSILSAFYLPNHPEVNIPEDITAVNIFRLIFNTYFGADFELLPNQQYYSSWARPYQFIDVTTMTDTPCVNP